ncbi:glycosyltransferase family 2 protein [Sphingomonas prati]|uniref:Cellulose synthase/poly-beta-1,6-N-acetylglucosamine synthase-like glycosyltransferase n=1 Tax=Sphingomonas prati TaxID=1843237 RepID=A0A7W9BT71_9SPHN|nr:glycosyltransferase family 2 protein [Sphingomonas prati]MBB5729697.1 cellulose synthase/poly-beta-1,6-N-acetylglucosamine synthase-like glycosyltransferase [Sphingomonas prati]GGE90163.1 glycosyl transferase [Sphingomonas prati]
MPNKTASVGTSVLTALAWLLAGIAAWPMTVVIVECLAGVRAPVAASPDDAVDPPPFGVMVPAHDEAAGIGPVLAAIHAELRPCDRILVVADNCTDATAAIARAAGSDVVERTAPDLRGKAYALAFGRDQLAADPPTVVVLVDADCRPLPGALRRLAASAARHDAAVQGRYLLDPPTTAGAAVRISAFAFMVRNMVRQRGLDRIAGMAQLQGSGMAMPWRIFSTAPLATASLVEDLKLGLDLALSGETVRFADDARFLAATASLTATATQRTRWEQGMLATATAYLPRLIAAGLARRPALLLIAADLSVPPLALLAALVGATLLVLGLVGVIGSSAAPFLFLLTVGCLFAGVLALVWSRLGRAVLPPRMITDLLGYVAWKQPIYLRLLRRREQSWIRTSRDP